MVIQANKAIPLNKAIQLNNLDMLPPLMVNLAMDSKLIHHKVLPMGLPHRALSFLQVSHPFKI
jgi:hypothetical protein